jgi:hypothetical protein
VDLVLEIYKRGSGAHLGVQVWGEHVSGLGAKVLVIGMGY